MSASLCCFLSIGLLVVVSAGEIQTLKTKLFPSEVEKLTDVTLVLYWFSLCLKALHKSLRGAYVRHCNVCVTEIKKCVVQAWSAALQHVFIKSCTSAIISLESVPPSVYLSHYFHLSLRFLLTFTASCASVSISFYWHVINLTIDFAAFIFSFTIKFVLQAALARIERRGDMFGKSSGRNEYQRTAFTAVAQRLINWSISPPVKYQVARQALPACLPRCHLFNLLSCSGIYCTHALPVTCVCCRQENGFCW